ncbi:sugar ABC transporter permease [Rhodospirillum rubrum]|uniref:ABC transporter permease n=1 Tax=Rhodospirillum rubrum TaxID=1085 RepID=UPI001907E15C|nr:ABC transporter permease [Rhodospirillum rubrum]MBK1662971.1 sugar ABC transporter permease [Rhodospirillum rubrum]MBK1675258.1 sugar ABC transporter permease [Rhodospirillum rubrum]
MTDLALDLPGAAKRPSTARALRWLIGHPPVITLGLIVLVSLVVGAISPEFWQVSNLFDMARASVVSGLFGLGVLIVLATGGLDVSFTAIAALTMYVITKTVTDYAPGTPIAVILACGAAGGALIGALNGQLVHSLKAPSLIVTIGTQYVIRGFLLTFIGTGLFMNIPLSMEAFGKYELWRSAAGNGSIAILPAYVLVLAVVSVVTWWILNRTLIGRAVYAVGGSPAIAERLGYNLRKVRVFAFMYAGLLAGIAGIIHVSSNRLANPFDLAGSELDVIAAVVLGGARITGGSGSVIGTLLGVVLVTLINNVLILAGVPSTWQKVIVGIFIVLAGTLFALRVSR